MNAKCILFFFLTGMVWMPWYGNNNEIMMNRSYVFINVFHSFEFAEKKKIRYFGNEKKLKDFRKWWKEVKNGIVIWKWFDLKCKTNCLFQDEHLCFWKLKWVWYQVLIGYKYKSIDFVVEKVFRSFESIELFF